MKKLLRKVGVFLGIIKPKRVKLSLTEYDELLDSKLEGIRKFVLMTVGARDGDKDFDKKFAEAFQTYVNAVKKKVEENDGEFKPEILISPYLDDLFGLTQRLRTSNIKRKIPLHKKIKFFFKRLVYKIKLYWKRIKMMREIRKMKKIMGGRIDNQLAYNLINAANLNKRMLERESYSI
jgi:hypothetical protein